MKYILYNPISGNGTACEYAEKNKCDECVAVDMTKIESYSELLTPLTEDDIVVIVGGDGTINRFVNDTDDIEIKAKIMYYPTGTGNDFCVDLGYPKDYDGLIDLDPYIKDLPTVTVNGTDRKFINAIGFGVDGYCCEVGDEVRNTGKKANYTAIAIKGLLFHYKPTGATITVDGVEHRYEKVWVAPTMFGGRYGGGMIPAPDQHRTNDPKTLSVMIFHGSNKLKTLMIFPKIFKGEHVKNKKHVDVLVGNDITVKFDGPRSLQIDGETVLGVTEYRAKL